MSTYYINADTGNDTTGDGSSGNPWLTLSKAISSSIAGDTIVCQAATATYTFATQSITDRTIQAANIGDAVFDGAGASAIWTINGTVTLQNLTFNNILGTANDGIFRTTTTLSIIAFIACRFQNISFTGKTNASLYREFPTTSTVSYTNCVFDDMPLITSSSNRLIACSSTAVTFTNCVLYFNAGPSGNYLILNSFGSTAWTITNSIILDESVYTPTLSSGGTISASYSTFRNISNPGGVGNITDDPLFVDAPNGNFNRRPTSPARWVGA